MSLAEELKQTIVDKARELRDEFRNPAPASTMRIKLRRELFEAVDELDENTESQ